jgi:HSP20 family protein
MFYEIKLPLESTTRKVLLNSLIDYGLVSSAKHIPTNKYEYDNCYRIDFLIPNIKKENLVIDLKEDTIHIKYEHSEEKVEHAVKCTKEFFTEDFSGIITCTKDMDLNTISAKYTDGILSITINKKEAEKPKKIKIN